MISRSALIVVLLLGFIEFAFFFLVKHYPLECESVCMVSGRQYLNGASKISGTAQKSNKVGALSDVIKFNNNPQINDATYCKLCVGMSCLNVLRIFGCPPGDYSGPGESMLVPLGLNGRPLDEQSAETHIECWVGHEKAIRLQFSKQGKVIDKMIVPVVKLE